MALTPSNMLALGSPAPDFHLPDVVTGQTFSLSSFADKDAFLAMFICRHCPFVIHIQEELTLLGNDYKTKNVGIVAISANDADTHPDDSPSNLKTMAEELGFTFPYCYDASQEVARAFQAACTPDFFLFDDQRQLVYRGQLDGSRPGNNEPVTGRDLRGALDAVISGAPVSSEQTPSIGCNIKWKTLSGGA